MRDDRLSLLSDMSGESNIEMGESVLVVAPMPDLRSRDGVEQV